MANESIVAFTREGTRLRLRRFAAELVGVDGIVTCITCLSVSTFATLCRVSAFLRSIRLRSINARLVSRSA